MKKVIIFLAIVILTVGCGENSARGVVTNYLKKYKTLDSEVLVDLENIVDKEDFTEEEKDKYREILKKQYKDLSYEIVEEEYAGDVTYVTVKISTYDLYKAMSDASIYLENNREEFNDEKGNYDYSKYIDYKLDKMKNTTKRIDYDIILVVTKEKDKYVLEQPTENDLLKIHGIYDYELE